MQLSNLLDYIKTEPVLALVIASIIFLITILFFAKRWIGFPLALLLLLFSLAVGTVINNQTAIKGYLSTTKTPQENSDFQIHMVKIVDDLKKEVASEKNSLNKIMGEVNDIFQQLDIQKQKLQDFIQESKEHFDRKTETSETVGTPTHNN